jgi:glycosyltransferase involved in cell wall biosynthesis
MANPLRVAQVTPYFYPVEGGVERYVLNLSKELVNLGHEVDVYTCGRSRNGEPLEPHSKVGYLTVRRFESIANLGEFGKIWPGFVIPLARGDYDIIHAHVFRHPHSDLALAASRICGAHAVLTSHSPFHPGYLRGPLARGLVPLYDGLIAPVTLRGFDRIISLTKNEAKALTSLGARKNSVITIPHGVDSAHLRKAGKERFLRQHYVGDKKVVLYLGRVNRTKGIHVLIDAFSKIRAARKDAVLFIVGPCTSPEEESFQQALIQECRNLGIEDSKIFLGHVTEEEKIEAYEACDVFVLPSLYEPYGLVLLEAAAHGKPIISTFTDGPLGIFQNGIDGLLVEPNNSRQLASKLQELLSDSALRKKIGANARRMAMEHSWENVGRAVEHVYQTIAVS